MNKRPIDKSKKSNIKCEHCKFFEPHYEINDLKNHNMCINPISPKFGEGTCNYWNRCKRFEWAESEG